MQPLNMGTVRAVKACYLQCTVQRMLMAIDRLDANLPLCVNFVNAVEMIRALRMEVTTQCIQNCYRKTGFMDPNRVDEDHTVDSNTPNEQDLWDLVINVPLCYLFNHPLPTHCFVSTTMAPAMKNTT